MIKVLLTAIAMAPLLLPVNDTASMPAGVGDPLCRRAVEYLEPPGVAYEPGVDVSGKPVVEADINKSTVVAPERIEAVITVDLGGYLGLLDATSTDASQGDTVIGDLIYENGEFTFNGEPLQGESIAALRRLCTHTQASENNHNDH